MTFSMSRAKDFVRARAWLFDVARRFDTRQSPSRMFFRNFSRGCAGRVNFLQIGASDGLRHDPIREFVVRDEWSGILVEPLPDVFELLKRNYRHVRGSRLVFVNAAVSAVQGQDLSFWTFSDDFLLTLPQEHRLDYLQKSSFDKEHVLRFARRLGIAEEAMREIRVPGLTVDKLIEQHWTGGPIDLLVIDAEGHEPAILSGINFATWAPRAIFFESHLLGTAKDKVFARLAANGYHLTQLEGDTAAVRE